MVERRNRTHRRLIPVYLLAIAWHQLSSMVMVAQSAAPGSTDPSGTQAPCVPAPPVFPDWSGMFAGTLASLGNGVANQLITIAKTTAATVNVTITFCAEKVNISAFNERLGGCNPIDLSAICRPQQTTFQSTAAFIPTSDSRSTVGMTSVAKMTSAPATSGAFNPPPVTTTSVKRSPTTASPEVDGVSFASTARSGNAVSSTLETAATPSQQTAPSDVVLPTVVSQSISDSTTILTTVFGPPDETPKTGEVVQPPNGLAQGAVAGIVIGVLFFVIIVVIIIALCIVVGCRGGKYSVDGEQTGNPESPRDATPPGTRAGVTPRNVNVFDQVKAKFFRVRREDSQVSTAPIITTSRQYSVESSEADSDSGIFTQSGGPPVTASKNIVLKHALQPLQKVDEQNVADWLQNSERIAPTRVPDMPRSDPLQRRVSAVDYNGSTSTLPRSLFKLQSNAAAGNGSAIAPGIVQSTPAFRNGIDNRAFRSDSVDDGGANKMAVMNEFDNVFNKLSQTEQGFLEIEMGSGQGLNDRTTGRVDGFDDYVTSTSSLDLKLPDEMNI